MLIALSDKNKEIVNNIGPPPRQSTGDKSGLCNWILCLFVCLSVLGKFSNFFLQYKAAAVRAVISISYGSKEGVQGSLLVHQYIVP